MTITARRDRNAGRGFAGLLDRRCRGPDAAGLLPGPDLAEAVAEQLEIRRSYRTGSGWGRKRLGTQSSRRPGGHGIACRTESAGFRVLHPPRLRCCISTGPATSSGGSIQPRGTAWTWTDEGYAYIGQDTVRKYDPRTGEILAEVARTPEREGGGRVGLPPPVERVPGQGTLEHAEVFMPSSPPDPQRRAERAALRLRSASNIPPARQWWWAASRRSASSRPTTRCMSPTTTWAGAYWC